MFGTSVQASAIPAVGGTLKAAYREVVFRPRISDFTSKDATCNRGTLRAVQRRAAFDVPGSVHHLHGIRGTRNLFRGVSTST